MTATLIFTPGTGKNFLKHAFRFYCAEHSIFLKISARVSLNDACGRIRHGTAHSTGVKERQIGLPRGTSRHSTARHARSASFFQ